MDMDIDEFLGLADAYAALGWVGRDAVKDVAAGDWEGHPERNIESARKFIARLARAGIDTYGAEKD